MVHALYPRNAETPIARMTRLVKGQKKLCLVAIIDQEQHVQG